MRYKSAAALEMAVKAAATASPLDTNRAISSFYFHRLLCRIFAGGNEEFVLKGGQSMLARTIDARATRDIDLLAKQRDLDAALKRLKELAEADMGDFITFEFAGARPIKAEDEYRSGLAVRFIPIIGSKSKQPISIDLVVDEVPLEMADFVVPSDRIEIDGLETCGYLVYPVESALADKFCALVERHDGRASSRVKDLVDIVVYATMCSVDGSRLQKCIQREASARKISLTGPFAVPESWGASHERQFEKLCSETGLPASLKTIVAASDLAGRLLDPAISCEAEGMSWSPAALGWTDLSSMTARCRG